MQYNILQKPSQNYAKIYRRGTACRAHGDMCAPAFFRAFFAIDIDDDNRNQIINFIKKLKQQSRFSASAGNDGGWFSIKWTKPENLHITMRFLGDILYSQYEDIITSVGKAIENIKPFSINLSDLIMFPTPDRPIAIAIKPIPIEPLIQLNQAIEEGLQGFDIKSEHRAFVPHLTLGKIKQKYDIKLPEINMPKIKCKIRDVKLFRSETTVERSSYFNLVCLPLDLYNQSIKNAMRK